MQSLCDELEEVSIPDTPEYLPCTDKDQNKAMFPDLDKEIMLEVGNEYVHASIMLPHGSQIVCSTEYGVCITQYTV